MGKLRLFRILLIVTLLFKGGEIQTSRKLHWISTDMSRRKEFEFLGRNSIVKDMTDLKEFMTLKATILQVNCGGILIFASKEHLKMEK